MVRLNPIITYGTPFPSINLLLSLRSGLRLVIATFRASCHQGPGLSIVPVYTGSCLIIIRYLMGSTATFFPNAILMFRDTGRKFLRKCMEFL